MICFSPFLSCLGGSELLASATWARVSFLSCLGGSERHFQLQPGVVNFLSCLGGSEPLENLMLQQRIISELPGRQRTWRDVKIF